ncbi:MAG: outer membrane lipoprotein carrier protein LolA [Phycisphaerales bacterium]|nr:outer membrane lipoprotein carrier protein LolA [Phycisphaerales bacterium]
MLKRMWVGMAAGLLLAGSAAADELQAAQKKIVDKWNDVKTLTASVSQKNKLKNGGLTGTGTYEYARHDGKFLYRLKLDKELVANPAGKEMKFAEKTETIHDGEATYTLSEAMGRKNATKEQAAPEKPEGGDRKTMFEKLNKDNVVKLLPEAKVGETECYVMEATPNAPKSRAQVIKTVFYFAKETGMIMQIVGKNSENEDAEVMTFSEIKVNEKIDPDRFKFKAPEGVQVRERGAPKP